MLLLYAVALGLLVGVLTHGRIGALASVKVRLWPVALLGLAFQAVLFSPPIASIVGNLGPSLYVLSTTLVLMALVFNLRQPGFWLITLGAFANFVVVIANGGQMPASPEAFAILNGSPVVPTMNFSNSVIAGPNTPLYFLADIYVLPRPFPLANILSLGDVMIGVGGGLFIVAVMHGRTGAFAQFRTRSPSPSPSPLPLPDAGSAARPTMSPPKRVHPSNA